MTPTVFLDRDGVINVDVGYPHRIEDFSFIEGAPQAIARMNKCGYLVIVVTNQSGIARGLYTEEQARLFNEHIQSQLSLWGAHIDKFYISPYHPQAIIERYRCDHHDRKPNPGMIEKAFKEFDIDKENSFLVGDRDTDIQAARAAGLKGYLFDGKNLDNFVSPLLKF
ncbi:HAD-IIIA family hydrolase [Aristophania vespae]|uniref:D,D-heptose 1,7-bisphosphate phosphatase n=1 Tax=Aristophania vespae TaxID=2697033 RepID=A0A6P1NB12_9PROT|nr:HAD family hydrolase [Aristophania vespae]QHI95845.1 HAD-IIIA family hydrolase [Aristophania vespae]UMM63562.1 D-glycero-alpha-D-manno-heptose-1,7-bisphosphate 7-phosphatase [Aristophania vespae]